jgi:hypothetical protein
MMKRGQNQRRRAWQNCDSAVSADVQCLDGRQLLVVNVLAPQIGLIAGTDQHSVTLRWEDADHDSAQAYHVWVDQQVNGTTVISKVYVNDRVTVSGAASSLTIPFSLQSGNYALSVRRISGSGRSPWTEPYAFTIDSRIGNQTGSSAELVPLPPAITVIREGQGYFGQASSEPALGWSSATVMHNVLLCRRATDGSWQRLADLRSVPGHVVTQRQLAQAAASSAANKAVFYGDLTSQSSVAGLAEGNYRLWVQSLNGAIDA